MTDAAGSFPLLFDLHVHLALPLLGSGWGDWQGFRPLRPRTGAARKPRGYGVACYQSFLLNPAWARRRLFRSLESPRLPAAGRLLRKAEDLPASEAAPGTAAAAGSDPDLYFLAVESLRYLRDPGDLARLWSLGVRSLQPIHFLDTPWGHSSREGFLPAAMGGLTALGREMLAEMGRIGFILDLAHMNYRTAAECLSAYAGPVMCSHTGLHELKPNARNLPAELAREVYRRGGVVGVTCWRHLLPLRGNPLDGRAAWTRAYCAVAAALAELAPEARVAVGSDRGAPIHSPAWLFGPRNLGEMENCLAASGWGPEKFSGFLAGQAVEFLRRSLPARS